jgi:glutathione-regulated potassium-efflux system ancillary protein KefC
MELAARLPAAAVVAVPLAKRLGLGAVLGYLLAGIADRPLGPGPDRERRRRILHFSEFGVVLLLFLIGLELEPDRLWSLRRPIFGWGGAQVAGVTLALFGAALLAGIGWKVALIAGLGLSLSSTAIALAIAGRAQPDAHARRPGRLRDPAVPGHRRDPDDRHRAPARRPRRRSSSGNGWGAGFKAVRRAGRLMLGGRYLVRPLLQVIARIRMREIFTAFALLLVIAIALLMQWVGMSMALGAFMAGVLLADSEYRHALETDLEPFKGLLLGLFFIAVGMSVDFGVFWPVPG